MKKVIVLGSTGSIGINTLDVISNYPEKFKVVGLAVNSNTKKLIEQIYRFKPKYVSVFDENKRKEIKNFLPKKVSLMPCGVEGICEMIESLKPDIVLNAIVGSSGLIPLIYAVRYSKRVCIANKEPVVMAGRFIMDMAKKNGCEILPVDSEPSAVFQAISGNRREDISTIILTASGGPFYSYNGNLSQIKPEQAIKHPRWNMGPKISVDSATLMNKGLEAIEIKNLFLVDLSKIEIVIHPQSIIHSAVEFCDGSIVAQMSNPDMRLPIQFSLTYPQRFKSSVKRLKLTEIKRLDFIKPDFKKFPLLKLAIIAGKKEDLYPCVLNAANEKAVELFLNKKIGFTDIYKIVNSVMEIFDKSKKTNNPDIEDIIEYDSWAKNKAIELYSSMKNVKI